MGSPAPGWRTHPSRHHVASTGETQEEIEIPGEIHEINQLLATEVNTYRAATDNDEVLQALKKTISVRMAGD